MNVFEMEGFLRGKCLPGDMKVNETTAEYLVRKLAQAGELKAAHSTLEKAREVTNCPDGVDLKEHLKQLVEIRNAAEKLVRCKGRYHSELNYRALAALFGVTTPDLPPLDSETPATDSILREAEARGRTEGVNFAASRLAAAYNHGLIDKPLSEVFDVVRMILTAKEDLANTPAEDGLSGEYAEQALKDWEAELRGGKAE